MALEIDGKDYCVQYTEKRGDDWKSDRVFADQFSAKQHADHVLHSRRVASVRVVQTRYYGYRRDDGTFAWEDDIGEREDGDRS
jgi:hypothetical protein